MDTQRFIDNIGHAFGAREYSVKAVINRLESEIKSLHQWLLDNEPGTQTWKEKRETMLRKIENLNEVKESNN